MKVIAITMAGLGKRFIEKGYSVPKYRIVVAKRSLFEWAIISLESFIRKNWFLYFITLKKDDIFIREECKNIGIKSYQIIKLDKPTDGQATTALQVESSVDTNSGPFLIYNIDTHIKPGVLRPVDYRGEGWIPCFPGKGSGWSFVRANKDNVALEVKEKVRISNNATVGLYGFSTFSIYREIYNEYYSIPQNIEKGEKYIAPLYNHMIKGGKKVYIHKILGKDVIPLGTPEEVEKYRASLL